MNAVLTKDMFLENLMKLATTGSISPDRVFPQADQKIAGILLWWYLRHPQALPSQMSDFSELPWHALKAIGHLMFSHEHDMIVRRKAYRDAYAQRKWEPWESAFQEDFCKQNLWEHAFHTAMKLIHEIESKEGAQGDILQMYLNFFLCHETMVPLPKSHPLAFPAREFSDLVWMNWRARELFRSELTLYPDRNGVSTITLCERKGIEGSITALYIIYRDYKEIGDILVSFGGYEESAVGDLTGMGWVNGMKEKFIPVLALAGFFLDTFNPDDHPLPVHVLAGIPQDPLK